MITEKVMELAYESVFINIETALESIIVGNKFERCKNTIKSVINQIKFLRSEIDRKDRALQRAKELLDYQLKGFIFCNDSSEITLEQIENVNDKAVLANNAKYILEIIKEIESCN